jgi:hypothetical protein
VQGVLIEVLEALNAFLEGQHATPRKRPTELEDRANGYYPRKKT